MRVVGSWFFGSNLGNNLSNHRPGSRDFPQYRDERPGQVAFGKTKATVGGCKVQGARCKVNGQLVRGLVTSWCRGLGRAGGLVASIVGSW